jgi:hypothetical protein
VKPFIVRAIIAALCALSLSGCIDSSRPILTDAQPVFGPHLRLQLFSLRKGYAHEPEQAEYAWNGALYVHAGGGMRDVTAFSVHPFEAGDYIIQSVPNERDRTTEYALLHTLINGVFQVIPVDDDDASEAARTANCHRGDKMSCRIETRDQLFIFARATAARQKKDGGLVIRLPDKAEHPARP